MAKILVVDDSALTRRSTVAVVDAMGHVSIEASNGAEALKLISSEDLDCIILDLLMPKVTGISVLEELGNRKDKTPVVVITADIQQTTRERCERLGVVAVLNKPVEENILRESLTDALNRS
jgi:two-component system, chemotaxis family, chemotaxis protein CheY